MITDNELEVAKSEAFKEGLAGAAGEPGIEGILTPEESDSFYRGFVTGLGIKNLGTNT